MIRRLLLSSALTAMALPAAAADLPSRKAPAVFVPPPPVFTWTGAYAGINAGYAFENVNATTSRGNDPLSLGLLAAGIAPAGVVTKGDGFTGGGQIGYNYQLGTGTLPAFGTMPGGVVIGVEADAAYTDLRANGVYLFPGANTNYGTRVNFVGTVRGRLGYAFDRFLVYGTGGFAYGDVRNFSTSTVVPAGAVVYAGSRSSLRPGFAYGGGVEYALGADSMLNVFQSSGVTLKGEFIRFDLGGSTTILNGNPAVLGAASSFTTRTRTVGDLVRVGLNFKFGAPAVPVVARY